MASFRFLDGDGRSPPSFLPRTGASLPDAVFAPRGRFGGFIAGEPHPGDALRREMLKDRIREEMRQEMAERRMIEEEVRQEMAERGEMVERQRLEEGLRQELANMEERRMMEQEVLQEMGMERAMGHHRLPPLALSPPLQLAFRPPARLALPPPPPGLLLMPHLPEGSMLVERHLPVPEPRFVDIREESPVWVRPVPNVWKEPAMSRTGSEPEVDEQERVPEVKQFQRKNSGIKRKGAAVAESSKAKRTDGQCLSCALCQVSATSKEALNDHLQGKKHQAMVSKLASKGTRNVAYMPKRDNASASTSKAGATLPKEFYGEKKIAMQVDGKLHHVIRKDTFLFCEPCGVKGNSTMMMISHLGGKKHMEWMASSSKATTNAEAVGDVSEEESAEEEDA